MHPIICTVVKLQVDYDLKSYESDDFKIYSLYSKYLTVE